MLSFYTGFILSWALVHDCSIISYIVNYLDIHTFISFGSTCSKLYNKDWLKWGYTFLLIEMWTFSSFAEENCMVAQKRNSTNTVTLLYPQTTLRTTRPHDMLLALNCPWYDLNRGRSLVVNLWKSHNG